MISGQNVPGQESMTYSCQGARESKVMISGQNVPGQESMTYKLSRCQRKQSCDQWTECPSTGINDLQAVEVAEKANL
jgi:hypothetical protein